MVCSVAVRVAYPPEVDPMMLLTPLILGIFLATSPPAPTVESLVRENEANLRKIHTIKGVLESRLSIDSGKTWTRSRAIAFSRSGEKEHIFAQDYYILNGGKLEKIKTFNDVLSTQDGLWTMMGTSTDQIPARRMTVLDELEGNKVSGLIRPPEPCEAFGHKFRTWAHDVMITPDPRYTLRELCQNNRDARPVEHVDSKDGLTWELSLKTPEISYLVSLSPSHGYLISKVEAKLSVGRYTCTVDEYMESEGGVFLPKRVKIDQTIKQRYLMETLMHDVEVNVPIDDNEFQVSFPEGIGVSNLAENVHYIWGKGKPELTFDTLDAFNSWKQSQTAGLMKQFGRAGSGRLEWVVLGVVFVLLAMLVVGRKFLRRAQASI